MWAEVLRTMEVDPLVNLVAPPLWASTGVIPLSIISVYVILFGDFQDAGANASNSIPDILRHYADCIVAAEKEVFLATSK